MEKIQNLDRGRKCTPENSRDSFKMELTHQRFENIREFLSDYFIMVERTAAQSAVARQYKITTGYKQTNHQKFNTSTPQQHSSQWEFQSRSVLEKEFSLS